MNVVNELYGKCLKLVHALPDEMTVANLVEHKGSLI